MIVWGDRLRTMFWQALQKEFADRGVTVDPFGDGPGFSASVRKYISSMKASGQDAGVFVNDVWKGRIDSEWKDALVKPAMLGPAEYAALDREVSQLASPSLTTQYVVYGLIVLLLAGLAWWFFARRARTTAPPQPASSPTKKS